MISKIVVSILVAAMFFSVGYAEQTQTQPLNTANPLVQKNERTYLFATIDIAEKLDKDKENDGNALSEHDYFFYHYVIIIKDFLQLKFDEQYKCECKSEDFEYYTVLSPQAWKEITKEVLKYRLHFYQVEKGKLINVRTGLSLLLNSSQELCEQGNVLAMEPEYHNFSFSFFDDDALTFILKGLPKDRIYVECEKSKTE